MTIGLISDTHSSLPPTLSQHFDGVDEIWHAGDIGSLEVMENLQKMSQICKYVYGNIDPPNIQHLTEEYIFWEVQGIKILMIHIAGPVGRYNVQVRQLIEQLHPQVLICGHSHILKVVRDDKFNLLHVNPGAAGNQGFHKVRTVIKLEIADGKIVKMDAIELGKRGALK